MTSLPTTLSVLLAVIVGATLVQVLNSLENRLRGKTNQTGLLDSLLPDDHVKYWDFVWMAVPPVAGGMLLAFWPGVNGGVAGAAGFLAAFLSVWPVYRFPVQLLGEGLQPFRSRLMVLYGLFMGMSAALTYAGFIVVDRLLPDAGTLERARVWVQFLDRLSSGALYRPAKYGLATLLVVGGLYFNRERVRIGRDAHGLKRELVIEETPSQPLTRDA